MTGSHQGQSNSGRNDGTSRREECEKRSSRREAGALEKPAGNERRPPEAPQRAAIRHQLMQADPPRDIRTIYRRAADRGQLDLEVIPESVLSMPFDLVRHDILMTLAPVGRCRIEQQIVDDLFMPLLRPHVSDQL